MLRHGLNCTSAAAPPPPPAPPAAAHASSPPHPPPYPRRCHPRWCRTCFHACPPPGGGTFSLGHTPPCSSRTAPAPQTARWCPAGSRSSCGAGRGRQRRAAAGAEEAQVGGVVVVGEGSLGTVGRGEHGQPLQARQQRCNDSSVSERGLPAASLQRAGALAWATRARLRRWAAPARLPGAPARRPCLKSAAG